LGLGLSIVAAGIKALAGHDIALKSAEGRGARISIEAPRSPAVEATQPLFALSEPAVAKMSSLFVWLVETDIVARTATRSLLDACRVLTEEATSLAQLQHGLAVSERRPDLIICGARPVDDCNPQAVLALMSEHWRGCVPMLILSEVASEEVLDATSAKIIHLCKPVEPNDLVRAITELCLSPAPAAAEE
jgi:hypothetical protein